jgi:hypothetical protein
MYNILSYAFCANSLENSTSTHEGNVIYDKSKFFALLTSFKAIDVRIRTFSNVWCLAKVPYYSQLPHLTQMPLTLRKTNKGSSNFTSLDFDALCLYSLAIIKVIIELIYSHDHMFIVPFHDLKVKGNQIVT